MAIIFRLLLMQYVNKCQSKGCILQVLWDPALVITFTLSMGIIARYLVGGFVHENSPAYGKNSSLLTLDELLNLYIFLSQALCLLCMHGVASSGQGLSPRDGV